jgi:hypothetical protein
MRKKTSWRPLTGKIGIIIQPKLNPGQGDWFGFFVLENWKIFPAQATVVTVEFMAGQA